MSSKRSTQAASSSLSSDQTSKNSKSSKIVTLRLAPALLARFSSKPSSRKDSKSKSSSSSTSTPTPLVASTSSTELASETNSTPAPGAPSALDTTADEAKTKKGIPAPKTGTKRGSGVGTESTPKARGKPGPKKKAKLEHGAVENGTPAARPWTTAAPLATHKLGPKANQGAINAGLRALDRTGKPCRKWERKGFSVKSFTGVSWQLPSWRAPKTTILKMDDDGKIASAPILNGDSKANNNSSSAMDSEKSHSGGDVDIRARTSNHASSPILGIAIPA